MTGTPLSRRAFLQTGAAAALALQAKAAPAPAREAPASMLGVPFARHERVRIGLIGAGARGQSLLNDLLGVPRAEVRAVCDVDPRRIRQTRERFARRGAPEPAFHEGGERAFEALCAREDLDLVIIATPWEWHAEMAVRAMREGKHVGVEVPAGVTLPQLHELVRVSEQTRRHCMMMENCCYGENELMVLTMARAGLFGTLTHGEAAYIHDLRGVMNERDPEGRYFSEAAWRRAWHTRENGNLYPTHGLGPVCWYMGVHKGDRLESIVSMSSLEASLGEDQKARFPERRETYVCGDINTSVLRTSRGRTILLQHDTVSPRPYSRHNLLQGTRGAFADYPGRLFLDETAKATGRHDWIQGEALKPWREQYTHELWRRVGEIARRNGGHGGMDYVMLFRIVECMTEGQAPDFDVYDAAAWSAPFPLSVASVRQGGAVQRIPDFTGGRWEIRG